MNSTDSRSSKYQAAEPPQILYIYREFWKTGTQTALDEIESKAARACIDLGCPHPYLGIESLIGSKEVWYLNGFASTAEQELVREKYSKKDLFATMSRFTRQRDPFQSEPGKDNYANYRPDLSRGAPWGMGMGRFLVISMTRDGPQGDGTVFETQEAMRFIVTPALTRAEADGKLACAPAGAKIFAIRPDFSMAAPEWIVADPAFWRGAQ